MFALENQVVGKGKRREEGINLCQRKKMVFKQENVRRLPE
jgi:hypothetical protein